MKRHLDEKIYKFCNERRLALSVCARVNNLTSIVEEWLNSLSSDKGRPLSFDQKNKFKKFKLEIIETVHKYAYLFGGSDAAILRKKVTDLQSKWKLCVGNLSEVNKLKSMVSVFVTINPIYSIHNLHKF